MNFKKLLFNFLKGFFIGLLIVIVFLTAGVIYVWFNYKDEVYPKVFLFGINLSGKRVEEVEMILATEEEEFSKQKIVLTFKQDTTKKWEVLPAEIDLDLDKEEILKEVFLQKRLKRDFSWLGKTYKLLVSPRIIKPKFVFTPEKLEGLITNIAFVINRPSQDALFEFQKETVVNFRPSVEGLEVDNEGLKDVVLNSFEQSPFREIIELELPVNVLKPKVETSQSNQLGIRELLAVGESFFFDSIPSRVHNIIVASSKFHGLVIPPGETFSFSANIGEISADTGYQQAYVIKEKKTILEDGGGVCQVSTTMFRAALNAGLPITERQPHYYRVSFYEQGGYPPGLDATVYPPSPDLKFKNDTSAHILIQTRVDKAVKRLTFEFYGTADGRKVDLQKPIIHSRTPAPEPVYIDDPTLPVGVVKRFDSAHPGAKVSIKRIVYNTDGSVKEDKTFWSNYVPWAAVYQRGTKQL